MDEPRADERESQSSGTLTVMTYNVGNGLAPPERLVAFLRGSGADVIGLQELGAEQAGAVAANLTDVYPHQRLLPLGFAGKGLLSRFPVAAARRLHLYPGRPDLAVRVEADGVPLTVLVIHLSPLREHWSGYVVNRATRRHLEGLAAFALRQAPAVLLGDFNMVAASPYDARLTALGLVDAFRAAGNGWGATLPRRLGQSSRVNHHLEWLPLLPLLRVDYIWYTPPVRVQRAWVGPDAGSDHLPVFARLSLDARPHQDES